VEIFFEQRIQKSLNRRWENADGTFLMSLEMFNCLQAEQTIAIRKREFLNKFGVINNVLCQVFIVNAEKELELCCS